MGVERRKNSKWWYGRWEVNGQRFCKNLNVRISGTPGDPSFERSRGMAQAALNDMVKLSNERARSEELVQEIHRIRTGREVGTILLSDLPEQWEGISRKKPPSKRYVAQCRSTLKRFSDFIQEHHHDAVSMDRVTRKMAKSFLAAEDERGVTPKTWNDTLKLLRSSFNHLSRDAGLVENPFDEIPPHISETVFRKPFTPAELQAILEEARDDDFIRPIIITGMCTAMRRGDCCLLKWEDVDLEKGFITVKTSKTGQTVDIPIFPILLDELQRTRRTRNPFAFPQQAEMYRTNPDGITWRVKKVLEKALVSEDEMDAPQLAEVSEDIILEKGEAYLAEFPDNDKSERMRTVFGLYMDGSSINQLVTQTGISKGCISNYLKEMEQACECQIIRGKNIVRKPSVALQKRREHGQRAASVRDFHSFRVTWVTLALNAGVPLELVQKVTGHKTAEIVMKHYFQPGREDFRNALQSAMPAMLMESTTEYKMPESPILMMDDIKTFIKGMNSNNWRERKKEALAKLAELNKWYISNIITE